MIATQIDPFCASPTDRTKGIVPAQNGGSVSVLLDFPVTQRDVEASMPLGQRQDDAV
jgi:hypothetical protein